MSFKRYYVMCKGHWEHISALCLGLVSYQVINCSQAPMTGSRKTQKQISVHDRVSSRKDNLDVKLKSFCKKDFKLNYEIN